MKTLLRPALGAVLVLVVAACAESSGQPWTPPPARTPAAETEAPASQVPGSEAPASEAPSSEAPASEAPSSEAPGSAAPGTQAPASAAPSAGASVPVESQDPGGRVIELELDANLQIKENGTKVTDIPVTPGETIVFHLTNTAGFAHNFYIGTDQALMADDRANLTGIADWTDAEPKELTWVVPADVTGLKFGCTVPGHYTVMQGTFTAAS